MRTIALSIIILSALTLSHSVYRGATTPSTPAPAENPALHTPEPSPKPTPGLQGYCWPLSGRDGETINFYVSGSGSRTVRFFRYTADEAGVHSTPMGTLTFSPRVQHTNDKAPLVGAGWARSFSKPIPTSSIWPSGIYPAELTDFSDKKFYITFIVKPKGRVVDGHLVAEDGHHVAVIANTNTWLAYNDWGGWSAAAGASHVSFLRPNPAASPIADVFPYGHLVRGELWILGWLEAEGYQPDVYADIDLEVDCSVLPGYSHIVLSTHPQYSTLNMYDHLKQIVNSGVSLLYLGGNGIYENAQYEVTPLYTGYDSRHPRIGPCTPITMPEPLPPQGMSFRTGVDTVIREAALWRVLRRPERSLLGVGTERCGVQGAPYEVLQSCHWLFRGTGLRNGDTIGRRGLNTGCGSGCGDGNGGAAGWIIDTSNGMGATGMPTGCTECTPGRDCPRLLPPGRDYSFPPNVTVLARGQNWREGETWKGAEMVYYDLPGGGFVFSVGSIQFGGSLAVDGNLQQIIRNALTPSPARITRPLELGNRRGFFPWRSVATGPADPLLYRISLTGLTLNEVCEADWYKIVELPSCPCGSDMCDRQLRIIFPSGVRIAWAEERAGGAYRDLEFFPSAPAEISSSFFSPSQLVFRAEGTTRRSYDLTFEFSTPRFCR